MDPRAELGDFLRSRRARLRPEDVGLPPAGGRRRVPGLRREELAMLAGVSVSYYTRLEQGHARNASPEVWDAIARVLGLDETERAHLTRLVQPEPSPRGAPAGEPRIRRELVQLLDAMETVPAYLLGRRMDVLGWNRMARALLFDFAARDPRERNMARLVFLEPSSRDLFAEWENKARETVGYLRTDVGRWPDDRALTELVGELSMKSEDFSRMWADYSITDKGHGTKRLHHPLVGDLALSYETFQLPANPGLYLVTYHAEPGSPSAEALRLLASWGIDENPAHPRFLRPEER
ncbi:transcriptional regulator [Streptomyces sp. TM32]|uniref:helix-turn-helix transcriptional regulator n=1 Tax=Streptomyces sp. TM32 TaxID=1652669 RepID=UPI0010134540|nr:helix-turn-helix transcriptional regulator [Streptomyces sp. TM32]RXS72038.1 transcriptional regulator [Streptomyces sp. TM32]